MLDFNLPGLNGLQVLQRIRAFDAAVRVVMITGRGNVELAVEAMKAGASDFLGKPVALSKLKRVLEKAFGDSPPMVELKDRVQQLLRAEARMTAGEAPAVLVLGETGSGKEVLARAIHFNGPRGERPFVELNCAALPQQLLESELFGHERGAFTDARERKLGLVETAEGGTLFLYEIGDMDLALQARLLKLLEEKTVRIIAATHRPLQALVAEQALRADLYYRPRVVQFELPLLRDPGHDILLLAQHFLQLLSQRHGTVTPQLDASAQRALLAHP